MNLFFYIEDKLITAPTSDSILDGVTRKSVIELAKDLGIEVETRQLSVSELVESVEKQNVKRNFWVRYCSCGFTNSRFWLSRRRLSTYKI